MHPDMPRHVTIQAEALRPKGKRVLISRRASDGVDLAFVTGSALFIRLMPEA